MKLFVIIKEKGELSNFYSGLITSTITWDQHEVKTQGVLHYSQYERLGRFTAREPDKFNTIKELIDRFTMLKETGKKDFIQRLLKLTNASQMWVHVKSDFPY